MPTKTFRFNVQDHVYLRELTRRLGTDQTEAIRRAMVAAVALLRKGDPILWVPPETTSAETQAARPPLQVVDKSRAARRKPPAKGRPNSKRSK